MANAFVPSVNAPSVSVQNASAPDANK